MVTLDKVTGPGTIDTVWETRYKSANPTADMARYTIEISVLAPIDRDMCAFSIHTYHLLASPAVIAAAYQGHLVFQDSPLPGQGDGEGEGRFQAADTPSPPVKASPPAGQGRTEN
jgi:hypothetical protein